MVSTKKRFRLPVPNTLSSKLIAGLLLVIIVIQLRWLSSSPVQRLSVGCIPTMQDEGSRRDWLEDAKKANQIEKEHDSPSQYFADDTASVYVANPAASASMNPGIINYEKTFVSYGASKCLPSFDEKMKAAAMERNYTCAKYAPFATEESRRVAFATITTGKPAEAYLRAIQSQMFASAVHGTSTHVLCEQLSDGAWNKIAFLLNLAMNEMLKPIDERLQWIMWIDRDAIVLDPCRPLSSFLPPDTAEYKDVKLITNNDGFGLNAGVFIFKVGDWAVDLFNTILAFRYYRPEAELVLDEQTAMEEIIHERKWSNCVVQVPWYWFNAYPDEENSVQTYKEGLEPENLEWFRARKGDYVVHFAGDDERSDRMPDWLNMLQDLGNVYEKSEQQRDITKEVREYWSNWLSKSLTKPLISGEKWKENNVNNRGKGHR